MYPKTLNNHRHDKRLKEYDIDGRFVEMFRGGEIESTQ